MRRALVTGGSSPIAANKLLYRTLPYDPERDFVAVAPTVLVPICITVHPSLGVADLAGLVQGALSVLPKKSADSSQG